MMKINKQEKISNLLLSISANNTIKLAFVLLFICIVFHNLIEALVLKVIVIPVLSYVNSSIVNDFVIILFLFLWLIYLYANKGKRYIVSSSAFIWLVLTLLVYSYYRFISKTFSFISFYYFEKVKYFDILYGILIVNVYLFFRGSIKLNKKKADSSFKFLEDIPVNKESDDSQGYSSYAISLANRIDNTIFSRSFAIGVNGEWGVGKTSFINILQSKIRKDNIIEINFNPWNSNTPQSIIQDFFDTLQYSLKPYHSNLSRQLKLYAEKLIKINDGSVSQSILLSVNLFEGFNTIKSLYDDINKYLRLINKKLVIYIDDLDRLDKQEIIEVIRLIRNTANFYNTVFIVAYDRNYINDALKNHNGYNHEQFLEKIFQVEINLPKNYSSLITATLMSKLRLLLDEKSQVVLNDDIWRDKYIYLWLNNGRDITRFANSFSLNYSKLHNEVDLTDFVYLELLRLKYPSVYNLIFTKTDLYFSTAIGSTDYVYVLTKSTRSQPNVTDDYLIYEDLKNRYLELSVPLHEIDKVWDIIKALFVNQKKHNTILSVVHPSKFNRYSSYSLLDSNLSEVEFGNARSTLSEDDFFTIIDSWIANGKRSDLLQRLYQIKSFDNRSDYEKIIKAIFYIIRTNTTSNYFSIYNDEDLIIKLGDYNNDKSKLYGGDTSKLKDLILGVFALAQSPFYYEARFIRLINKPNTFIPLKTEELNDIVFGYFDKYCKDLNSLDKNVWWLFHSCAYEVNHGGVNTVVYQPKAIDLLRTTVDKYLDQYLLELINIDSFNNERYTINLEHIHLVWNSWRLFKDFIYDKNEFDYKYLREFKFFLEAFEDNGFNGFVKFHFKDIPVRK